jgi:hypothetical protein
MRSGNEEMAAKGIEGKERTSVVQEIKDVRKK